MALWRGIAQTRWRNTEGVEIGRIVLRFIRYPGQKCAACSARGNSVFFLSSYRISSVSVTALAKTQRN